MSSFIRTEFRTLYIMCGSNMELFLHKITEMFDAIEQRHEREIQNRDAEIVRLSIEVESNYDPSGV